MKVWIVEKYIRDQDMYFPIKLFPSTDKSEEFSERLDNSFIGFFENLYSDYSNVSVRRIILCFEKELFALYNVFYWVGDKQYGNAYHVFEAEVDEQYMIEHHKIAATRKR